MKTYVTKNYQETFDLGKSLAVKCQGGEIFALTGSLGAGKTAFAQGVAKGLGVTNTVNSPTFNIIKIYPIKKPVLSNITEFIHVDAYRLQSSAEIKALGIDEMINDHSSLVLIEWAEKVQDILPAKYFNINIKIISQSEKRKITIT